VKLNDCEGSEDCDGHSGTAGGTMSTGSVGGAEAGSIAPGSLPGSSAPNDTDEPKETAEASLWSDLCESGESSLSGGRGESGRCTCCFTGSGITPSGAFTLAFSRAELIEATVSLNDFCPRS